ncbi:MAG: glycosyltransferase N-terminal domain-containing protein [Bacteroidota bacterium]
MLILYNISIHIYCFLIQIVGLFRLKAKLWITGRHNLFERLAEQVDTNKKTVWMHCASLGEFEQGRPILESIRKDYPDWQIVLSFFSPSGYEIRKSYEGANVVTYLPLDTRKNAERFIDMVQPELVVFVKYEFWYHHLSVLAERSIPTYLVSAIFRADQWFFKSYFGRLGRRMLFTFDHIFVQNNTSARLLQDIGYEKVSVVGDTRIDRVLQIAKTAEQLPIINDFVQGRPALVVGSSWAADEQILLSYIHQYPDDWQYIIAPHDVNKSHIDALASAIQVPFQRYSTYQFEEEASVLLVDNIGLLSRIYQYGTVAYIGGGFGSGIHNTLEPAAFNLPILFGPRYHKFEEAVQLVQSGGAFVITSVADLSAFLTQLRQSSAHQTAAKSVQSYLIVHKGATSRIMNMIKLKF